ncbi:hypothetical protein [Mucilaginibacter sp.]|uniref:hypothetical protein n=1 Tax=Mucilaginibacter sp. TaxID=1882438 RepID=UPI0032674E4E
MIGIGGFDKKALSEIKLYKLPPIKKLDWINIAAQDSITCKDGTPFNTVFKINKYRYRLPDKDGLEYYYMCDYDVRHAEFPATVVMNCKTFLYDFYGILIVYNRNEESAKVLPIYFDTFGGDYLTYSRHFYIDSKFTIHVIDSAVGEESIVLGNRYDISILPDGNVANHIKK